MSLLMDPSIRYSSDDTQPAVNPPEVPSDVKLEYAIIEFMQSLSITIEQARKILFQTQGQCHSEWFAAHRYQIIASYFWLIHR